MIWNVYSGMMVICRYPSMHVAYLLMHEIIPWKYTRLRLGFDWISMDDGWQRCNCSVPGPWASLRKGHAIDMLIYLWPRPFESFRSFLPPTRLLSVSLRSIHQKNCHFHTMLCNWCCWLSTGPGSKLAQVWWQFVLWGALLLARQSRPTHGAERSLPRHVPLFEVCIIILHLWWLPPVPAQQHKIFLHFLAFQNHHDVCESVGANQSFSKGCELCPCLSVTQCDSC